jgi:hypothetical protein
MMQNTQPADPAGFLSDTDGISDSAFATAVLLEIQRIGGDADTISAPQTGPTPYPCDSIISLHGITACGSDADQCARNWRRMARWITHTTAPISETKAQRLAWACEAMRAPATHCTPDQLRRACKDAIALTPIYETETRHTANLLLAAPNTAACARSSR